MSQGPKPRPKRYCFDPVVENVHITLEITFLNLAHIHYNLINPEGCTSITL